MNIEEEFLSEVETKIKTKPKARKKSINSKRKGSAAELDLAHILNERFQGYTFARSVQSGAYTGGFNQSRAEALTEEQKLVFSGDIRVPKNFKFTIEHKAYAEFDFFGSVANAGNANCISISSATESESSFFFMLSLPFLFFLFVAA